MKSPDEAYYQKWAETPEPSLPEPDPKIVLDAGLEEQAWLYDVENEEDAYLLYEGETMERVK